MPLTLLASIIVLPSWILRCHISQRLQQKEGETRRRRLRSSASIHLALTFWFALVQGGGYLTYIHSLGGCEIPDMSGFTFWMDE